jgi:hypothetical protein
MGLLGSAPPPRELINVPTAEEGIDSGLKRSVREAGLDSVNRIFPINPIIITKWDQYIIV